MSFTATGVSDHDHHDTLALLDAQHATAAGMSLEDFKLAEQRAELEETAATWALIEARGCCAPHAALRCDDSCIDANEGWRDDAGSLEGSASEVGLRLAAAREALGRRHDAIAALNRAIYRDPSCARVRLARAKLLFRSGKKGEAGQALDPLLEATRRMLGRGHEGDKLRLRLDLHTAAEAFYIAGWVHIHADDHTAAYALWCEGATLMPSDLRLQRQQRKTETWGNLSAADEECFDEGGINLQQPLLRFALPPTGCLSPLEWTYFTLQSSESAAEPALRLFAPSQRGCIAVQTRTPLLPLAECREVMRIVDDHIAVHKGGSWGTVRRATVPTTDIAG